MIHLTRMLVPVDFGDAGGAALAYAGALAAKYEAELHLLHVVPRVKLGWVRGPTREERIRLAKQKLEESSVSAVTPQVKTHREVRYGSPSRTLIAYAIENHIDLMILDRRAIGELNDRGFQRLLSTAVRECSCPVLVMGRVGSPSREPHVSRGVSILREHFGDELAGEREETTAQMRDMLARKMKMARRHVDRLLDDLESSRILEWEGPSGVGDEIGAEAVGKWKIASRTVDTTGEQTDVAPQAAEVGEEKSPALSLLQRAIAARATDVHIDPGRDGNYVVRFRVDGRVEEYCRVQHDVAGSLMKQLKLLSNISLADPFQPSESRLQLPPSMSDYEVRITTAPVPDGQAIALRLIDRDRLFRPLNELGLSPSSFTAVYRMLHQRSGLVLITGPTGVGKTTTAYSMLNVLHSEHQNIMSIEDPVELLVHFIRQFNVDERHGFTMKVGLSTLLRMDPDVVFVGEIRSAETAETAIQAACCGKRVISTMHMRDVSATVSAMRELDIDSRSLADNLTGIITQRLVRRLCRHCSEPGEITDHERELFAASDIEHPKELMRSRGCKLCRNTGYKDRVGVFEAVVVDGDVAEGVRNGCSEDEIRKIIRAAGTPSLLTDGLARVRDGITTIEDVQEMSWVGESVPMVETSTWRDEIYQRGVPSNAAE